MASEQSVRVTNAFHKYVRTGDKTLIQPFGAVEIERAIIEYSNPVDKHAPFYRAMEVRLAEIQKRDRTKTDTLQRWEDRILFLFIGVVVTILANLIWRWIS